jgi:hypothetical protein
MSEENGQPADVLATDNDSLNKIKAGLNTEKEAETNKEVDSEKNKPSDREAELLKESMKRKELIKTLELEKKELAEKMKQYEGVDIERAKKMLADQEALENKRKEEESKLLEQKGEWEKLKEQMRQDNEGRVLSEKKRAEEAEAKLNTYKNQLDNLTLANSFSSSTFIKDEIILSSSMVQKLFGDFFEVEEGAVVAYDSPRGSSNRVKLVNADGNNLKFEEAMKKVIDGYSDKDSILRTSIKPGANSFHSGAKSPDPLSKTSNLSAMDKIKEGLRNVKK